MPQIPFFATDENVAPEPAGARADPTAFGQPGAELAAGAGAVGGLAAEFANRYADMRRVRDAADLSSNAAKQAEDLYFQQSKIPDAAAAQQGFNDGFAQIRKSTLARTTDPTVLSHVIPRLDEIGLNLSTQTRATAFGHEAQAAIGNTELEAASLLPRIAAAPNAFYKAQLMDGYLAKIKGYQAAGLINGDAAARMEVTFRSNVAEADAWQDAARDPIGTAQALAEPASYPGMTQYAKGQLLWRIEPRANSAKVKDYINQVLPEPVSVPPQIAPLLDQATAGSPVPRSLVAAVAQHESSWNPQAVSNTGAIGLGQVLPSTARNPGFGMQGVDPATLTDPAVNLKFTVDYLGALGRKHGVTDWTNADQVRAVLEDYNGEPTKAKYATDVLSLMHAAPAQGPPDEAALMQKAEDITRDNPNLTDAVIGGVQRRIGEWRASTAVARGSLERDLRDLQPALLAGQDLPIPGDRIRALLPPEQADGIMRNLEIASIGGTVLKSLQFATPDQVQQAQADLTSGLGVTSTLLRLRLAKAGVPGAADAGAAETPEAFHLRTELADAVSKQLVARQQALTTDPAAYVAAHPLVAAAAQTIRPDDPPSFTHYADTSLAVQAQLGVAPENRRVLGVQQSAAIAQAVLTSDPAKVDAGAALDGMAKQYGDAWPDVFHDIVRDGHLPPEWQVLAQMNAGPQRTEMQRALQASRAKGAEGLRGEIDPAAAQQIDRGLDGALADFRQSIFVPGLNADPGVYGAMRQAVKTLADWNVLHGAAPGPALDAAVKATLPYDYEDRARAPTGQGPQASAQAASMLAALRGADLGAVTGAPGTQDAERQDAYAERLKANGVWLTTPKGDGWELWLPGTDGGWQAPTRADGSRIGFKFSDLPHGAPPMPSLDQAPGPN